MVQKCCQHSYHRKCQRRGVGGQKSQNRVNVVCEQPLTKITMVHQIKLYRQSSAYAVFEKWQNDTSKTMLLENRVSKGLPVYMKLRLFWIFFGTINLPCIDPFHTHHENTLPSYAT